MSTGPFECHACRALMPTGESHLKSRHMPDCPSFAPRARRAHFVIAWSFHRSPKANVTIEIDPRGSAHLVVRPYRSRLEVRAELAAVAQKLVEQHLRQLAAAKRKARAVARKARR
jgi:hypothetical protein